MIKVSVVVPTMGNAARAPLLRNALECLFSQRNAEVVPIVVANGPHREKEVIDWLKGDRRIRLVERDEGVPPRAVAAGRAVVDTEYFGVLDDDDLFLPNACEVRSAALAADPSIDAVITNGYERNSRGDALNEFDAAQCQRDPAGSLMRHNWLASCAGFYRTATVGPEIFAEAPRLTEWTYIALRLAISRKLKFVDEPTYVVCTETVNSVSKSLDFARYQPIAIQKMLQLPLPEHVQSALRRKYCASLHLLSRRELKDGNVLQAWWAHLRCVARRPGWRYLTATPQLLPPSFSRFSGARSLNRAD